MFFSLGFSVWKGGERNGSFFFFYGPGVGYRWGLPGLKQNFITWGKIIGIIFIGLGLGGGEAFLFFYFLFV